MAGPYNEDTVKSVAAHFEKLLGQPVTFAVTQDDKLIGGFRALVDGKLYDASIATQTERMLCHLADKGQG